MPDLKATPTPISEQDAWYPADGAEHCGSNLRVVGLETAQKLERDRKRLQDMLIEVLDKVQLSDSTPHHVPTAAKARAVLNSLEAQ